LYSLLQPPLLLQPLQVQLAVQPLQPCKAMRHMMLGSRLLQVLRLKTRALEMRLSWAHLQSLRQDQAQQQQKQQKQQQMQQQQ
jgi:hypothetical protein